MLVHRHRLEGGGNSHGEGGEYKRRWTCGGRKGEGDGEVEGKTG